MYNNVEPGILCSTRVYSSSNFSYFGCSYFYRSGKNVLIYCLWRGLVTWAVRRRLTGRLRLKHPRIACDFRNCLHLSLHQQPYPILLRNLASSSKSMQPQLEFNTRYMPSYLATSFPPLPLINPVIWSLQNAAFSHPSKGWIKESTMQLWGEQPKFLCSYGHSSVVFRMWTLGIASKGYFSRYGGNLCFHSRNYWLVEVLFKNVMRVSKEKDFLFKNADAPPDHQRLFPNKWLRSRYCIQFRCILA